MDILRISAFLILGALACVVLKKYLPEQAFLVSLAVVAAGSLYVLPFLEELRQTALTLADGAAADNLPLVFRALGICLLTQTGARLCADYGQTALSTQLETGGRVAVLLVSLPLVRQLLGIVSELMR